MSGGETAVAQAGGVSEKYSEQFAATRNLHESSRALAILDGSLRGVGQIFLMNNPLTGLIMVVGAAVVSPWAAFLFVLGAVIGTLTAVVVGLPTAIWRDGLYGFNGALIGLLGGVFLVDEWSLRVAVFTLLAAGVSTPVMHATVVILTERLGVPALSLTFGLLGVMMLLLAPAVAYGRADIALMLPVERLSEQTDPTLRSAESGNPVDLVTGLFNAVLRSLSEVLLLDSIVLGALILLALLACSRIAAVLAVAGALTGSIVGLVMGADGYEVYLGLWGYNGAVVAVALGGIVLDARWRSIVIALVGAGASALLYGALSELLGPYGVVPLSLPLVVVIIGTALAAQGMESVRPVPLSEYGAFETRRRALSGR